MQFMLTIIINFTGTIYYEQIEIPVYDIIIIILRKKIFGTFLQCISINTSIFGSKVGFITFEAHFFDI